jgi:hypothetical protein
VAVLLAQLELLRKKRAAKAHVMALATQLSGKTNGDISEEFMSGVLDSIEKTTRVLSGSVAADHGFVGELFESKKACWQGAFVPLARAEQRNPWWLACWTNRHVEWRQRQQQDWSFLPASRRIVLDRAGTELRQPLTLFCASCTIFGPHRPIRAEIYLPDVYLIEKAARPRQRAA